MKKLYFAVLYLLVSVFVIGQTPVIYENFDTEKINHNTVKQQLADSEYAHVGFTPTFSPGLKGYALDLTSDVGVRIPIELDSTIVPSYKENFAISVWVKTKPGARQGTPIITNKKNSDKKSAGWSIGTDTSGAWYFNISDGKGVYDYEPTPQRQAVNDGQWHHIAVSVDLDKKEMWCYFDGKNVAIYNLENLSDANSTLRTIIGGSDEYSDWGSRREWTAFNGMIDEVKVYNQSISTEQVKNIYTEIIPASSDNMLERSPSKLKVQVWNIWHGGRRFGEHVGVERVIDVLKKENADIIGLIETYGSGAIIADSLGYYFYLISSNLSIMSRYLYPANHKSDKHLI